MILFPVSARVLTPGHIRCIDHLAAKGKLVVSVLTAKALKGYKKEVVPFKDRMFIIERVTCSDDLVVPQNSLDPTNNLKKYKCTHIASGDGWEPVELEAIKKLGVILIHIKLPNEVHKKYSSSVILRG